MSAQGPLADIRVLEIESIGPGPFAAMALADLGASVIRISRPGGGPKIASNPVLGRGRAATIELDLKSVAGRERVLELIGKADALIEGYRPGVMERLGLGPEPVLARNPRLIYGRMTGWGRAGPLAPTAGHDINYIALTGALHSIGTKESGPVPPLNLVGDFGGGGLVLAFGILAALLELRTSGKGQVVDAAMVDGASMLMAMIYGMRANGRWTGERANNMLDGAAWYYRCYATRDGGWIAVGCIEPEFRQLFVDRLGVSAEEAARFLKSDDYDPAMHARIAEIVASRTRDEWAAVYEGTDACVSPVLAMDEVMNHPHNQAWGSFARVDGAIAPMPAPRFSRTAPRAPGSGGGDKLAAWGLGAADVTVAHH